MTDAQCDACGEANPAGAAFCHLCGAYLGWDRAGQQPGPAPAPSPQRAEDPAGEPPREATRAAAPMPPTAPPTAPSPASPTPSAPPSATPPAVSTSREPPAPTRPAGTACPACGTGNPPERRFCGRCGQPLVAAPAPAVAAPSSGAAAPDGRWGGDARTRAARRAYRRSLPAFYRWRRVLLGVLAVAVAGGLVAFAAGDPVGRVRALWTTVTGGYAEVEDVVASGEAVPPYTAESAVDGDHLKAWAVPWPGGAGAAGPCGTSPAGALTLSWPEPADLERIDVRAGLDEEASRRPTQYRPRRLDVRTEDGRCVSVELEDEGGWQRLPLEEMGAARSVTLSVASVYPNSAEPLDPVVAVSEVRLQAVPGG